MLLMTRTKRKKSVNTNQDKLGRKFMSFEDPQTFEKFYILHD